jgi:hypothetical protein
LVETCTCGEPPGIVLPGIEPPGIVLPGIVLPGIDSHGWAPTRVAPRRAPLPPASSLPYSSHDLPDTA